MLKSFHKMIVKEKLLEYSAELAITDNLVILPNYQNRQISSLLRESTCLKIRGKVEYDVRAWVHKLLFLCKLTLMTPSSTFFRECCK